MYPEKYAYITKEQDIRVQRPSTPLRYLLIGCIALLTGTFPADARLIVSELYRDPTGNEDRLGGGKSHEFIELINLGQDAVSMDSLYITNGSETDAVVPLRETLPGHETCRYNQTVIPPGAIAVILDPDYRQAIDENPQSRFTLPPGTILFECGDDEFGANGLTADNGIIIYRGNRQNIDSLLCSAVDPGTSLREPQAHKLLLTSPKNREGYSVIATNVLAPVPIYETCGTECSPGRFEPLRNGWIAEWRLGNHDSTSPTVRCSVSVLNAARSGARPDGWYCEAAGETPPRVAVSGPLQLSSSAGSVSFAIPVDSVRLYFSLGLPGRPSWEIDLSTVWLPSASVRITEIFPKKTSAEPEWFEVMNTTRMRINLKNWRFGNSDDTTFITEIDHYLDPGRLAVITKNRRTLSERYWGLTHIVQPDTWHTLGNTHDTIFMIDGNGSLHETVCYDARWFDSWSYLSLERNDNADGCSRLSWSVAARATPEKPNNALHWRSSDTPAMDIGPLPFITSGCGDQQRLVMRFTLPASAHASVTIYGFDGRPLHRIPDIREETVFWNGCGNNGPAPPGPFFVVAEITGNGRTGHIRKKGILWRK